MEEFCGILKDFTFKNDESQFGIAYFIVSGMSEPIKIIGSISAMTEGEFYEIECKKEKYKDSDQYKVISYFLGEPHDKESISYYIASKFYGIGEIYSKRIVNFLGENTLSKLDSDPKQIKLVKNIRNKHKEDIINNWIKIRKSDGIARELLLFLKDSKLGAARINKILKHFYSLDKELLFKNPYSILDISEINFEIADRVALKIGIDLDSPLRLYHGVISYANKLIVDGNCSIEKDKLIEQCLIKLFRDENKINNALNEAFSKNKLYLINETDSVMPSVYYETENNLAWKIKEKNIKNKMFSKKELECVFKHVFETPNFSYNEDQKKAIKNVFDNKISIITGGPGTGKTTIIKAIINIAYRINPNSKISLIAPTGKAANRMFETTGHEASTVHKKILMAAKNGENINADIIILDESSMADLFLMNDLFLAIDDHATIVIIGDTDQLPSIGPGQVLKDLLRSPSIPSTQLKFAYRFEDNLIKINSQNIINGLPLVLPESGNKNSDFYFMKYNKNSYSQKFFSYEEMLLEYTLKLLLEKIPNLKKADPLEDIQILVPMNVGQLGTINLNKKIQEKINPFSGDENEIVIYNIFSENKENAKKESRIYRINDKVMQTDNDYTKGVFNGDIGYIIDINKKNMSISVKFDNNICIYDKTDINQLNHAYALTIHKSQGSEYKYVILPLYYGQKRMLERKLFYTAETRAKEMLILLGDEESVDYAIKNNKNDERKTNLSEKIKKLA